MKTICLIFLFCASTTRAHASETPSADKAIDAAIANRARPTDDRQVDERRHPRDLLAFSRVKSGDLVIDAFPGKGYFTRLFTSVVGPKGHVIAYVPKELEAMPFKPVEAANKAVQGAPNAEAKVTPLAVAPAENVDLIWTSQNYHDLHIKKLMNADVAAYDKLLFKMLKPGGHLVVVDHVAAPGTNESGVEKLHRIDPQVVRKELEAAGFVFEAESKTLLRDENHQLNVFDPMIRGKTDQFAYRFVKPKKS